MNNSLITVVVPVYKTEKYLNRCIESIVRQTYRNLEILLIDDGSPDACPQICDAWAERDRRIRVIHKHNEGQGIARNCGIDGAKGEYICFFDSDDYIAPNTLEKAYGKIQDTEADLVVFGFSVVDPEGVRSEFVPDDIPGIFEGESVKKKFLPDLIAPDYRQQGHRKYYMSAWLMLYSMDVIDQSGWRFVSEREIVSEDVYSLLALMPHIRRVAILPEVLYFYYANDTSFSRAYRADRYERIRYFYQQSIMLCDQLGYDNEVIYRMADPYLAYTVAALKQEVAAHIDVEKKYQSIRAIIHDDLLQQTLYLVKENKYGIKKKLLFWAIRNKLDLLVYLLLKLQITSKNRQQ